MALTVYLFAVLCAGYAIWRLISFFQDPLRSIPGPYLARLTQLWCFRRFSLGNWHNQIVDLHREHGTIVRYAPGKYSISDPSAIKPITGHGIGFDKSSFYETWAPPGKTSLFKERDNHVHGQLRKRFASMYSMTSAYTYEKGVGECVELLCQKLEEHNGKQIDLAWWMTCFAFDSVGIVTYGKRFGFLDDGREIENLSQSVYGAFTYGSFMGMYPEWHGPFLATSRFLTKITKWSGTGKMYLDSYTWKTISQRREDRSQDPSISKAKEGEPTTILDKFLNANENDPAYFTDDHMTMGLGANVTAGSDTTSTTIAFALYYLLKNPETLAKLREEISSVGEGSSLSMRTALSMPYLNAVMDETLRVFPQTGFGLPRVVPPEGADICGYHFPAGSTVSLNAWAMHYDPANFDDPEAFRPERWLQADQKKREKMNQCYFPFGLGSRTCIGKNIAMLVMLKALPQLVERFDFEFAGDLKDGKDLPTMNIFLVRATEFPAVVRLRVAEV